MSNAATVATLTKLARDNPKRRDFNKAVKAAFPVCLGEGAFRKVYEAGDTVIKLRRHEPRRGNAFPMSQIDSSNADEANGYTKFKKKNAVFAHFVLEPTYVSLPNGHDAVLMKKADFVWGTTPHQIRSEIENKRHDVHNQIQIICEVFQDAHDNNIGVIGNRAFLVDFNFDKLWNSASDYKERARKVLEAVGVRFRGRKPALKAMEAA